MLVPISRSSPNESLTGDVIALFHITVTWYFTLNYTMCLYSFLMDLELRLHLAAEDVDVALEMDSARALQRIPAAVQEILHLRVGPWHIFYIQCFERCCIQHAQLASSLCWRQGGERRERREEDKCCAGGCHGAEGRYQEGTGHCLSSRQRFQHECGAPG